MWNIRRCQPNSCKRCNAQLLEEYESYKAQGLKLNMARGKPSSEQLDLSMGMLGLLTPQSRFARVHRR